MTERELEVIENKIVDNIDDELQKINSVEYKIDLLDMIKESIENLLSELEE